MERPGARICFHSCNELLDFPDVEQDSASSWLTVPPLHLWFVQTQNQVLLSATYYLGAAHGLLCKQFVKGFACMWMPWQCSCRPTALHLTLLCCAEQAEQPSIGSPCCCSKCHEGLVRLTHLCFEVSIIDPRSLSGQMH